MFGESNDENIGDVRKEASERKHTATALDGTA
jgi:hypothetical protein